MSSAQSRPTHRRNGRCNKCGSSNIQSIEMAYIQGVRHSESGYTSISKFSERIAPPEEKSLLAEPMFTAIGLAGATFLLSTLFGEHLPFPNPVSARSNGQNEHYPALDCRDRGVLLEAGLSDQAQRHHRC